MDKRRAKGIGSKAGLKAVAAGIIMGQIIMTVLSMNDGPFKAVAWFLNTEFIYNVIFFLIVAVIAGHLFGQSASKAILINHKNYNLEGGKFSLFTLATSATISSCISFLIEGTDKIGTKGETPISDYIVTPVFMVLLFGLIPALIVGYWFGKQIRKHLKFK